MSIGDKVELEHKDSLVKRRIYTRGHLVRRLDT